MNNSKVVPLIYNLFPRHFSLIDSWAEAVPHIAAMGFNAVFVNPFHETGFSGSLYAVKDYYRLNPLFLKDKQDPTDFTPLKNFIAKCQDANLEIIMDLVINHTAVDSVLTVQHPRWFKLDAKGKIMNPFAIDPGNPSNVTVWGDLATIDNESSSDRENLWNYWDNLIGFYQGMGIFGFRCDAAYQVPAPLWTRLVSHAKGRNHKTRFYAETLGCTLKQIDALKNVGFDYLFNSSKWWNFDQPWAIEQHALNKTVAPSIAFPESHDTERLASEPPKTEKFQKMRYAFAALFSEGLMMTMGYEYGATTRMDVVKGSPKDLDTPQWDISEWVKQINAIKEAIPVLREEGAWRVLNEYHQPYIFMEKLSDQGNPALYVCINKEKSKELPLQAWMLPEEIRSCSTTYDLLAKTIKQGPIPDGFILEPSDIVIFLK